MLLNKKRVDLFALRKDCHQNTAQTIKNSSLIKLKKIVIQKRLEFKFQIYKHEIPKSELIRVNNAIRLFEKSRIFALSFRIK